MDSSSCFSLGFSKPNETLFPPAPLGLSSDSSSSGLMECRDAVVSFLSWALVIGGVAFMLQQMKSHTQYGRYRPAGGRCCPARLAWFLQEVPAFLLPLLLLLFTESGSGSGTRRTLLLCAFMLHYFHRSAPI